MDEEEVKEPENNSMFTGDELLDGYRQMLTSMFYSVGGILIALVAVSLIIHYFMAPSSGENDLPVLMFVAVAGALGALISALMRMYTLKDLPRVLFHPNLRNLRNKYLAMYSFVPVLVGSVSATVLYLAVAGELIGGELFANFDCKLESGNCKSFRDFFSYGPKMEVDHAKALVWGFASGFSERLVPDVIGKIQKSID
jgi:hypothetical protein